MQKSSFVELDPGRFKEALVAEIKNILLDHLEQKKPPKATELLTREEVAKLFEVSPITIYRWTKEGRLPCYGLGNRVYYKSHEIKNEI